VSLTALPPSSHAPARLTVYDATSQQRDDTKAEQLDAFIGISVSGIVMPLFRLKPSEARTQSTRIIRRPDHHLVNMLDSHQRLERQSKSLLSFPVQIVPKQQSNRNPDASEL
jgi:hypothetical protein